MAVESRKRHQMRHLDVLYRLLRDQEVDGSNPLLPRNFWFFVYSAVDDFVDGKVLKA
jgi:hypothetical protein